MIQASNFEAEANKIIDFCIEARFAIPEGKLNYAVGGSIGVAAYLKQRCCLLLGLVDIEERMVEELVLVIQQYFVQMSQFIGEGIHSTNETNQEVIDRTVPALFLHEYEYLKYEFKPPKQFFRFYYLLALQDLANFNFSNSLSFASKKSFNDPNLANKYLKHSIDAQGHLMCAQEAVRYGDACIERTLGNERYSQSALDIAKLQSDLNVEKTISSGPRILMEGNKTRSEEATRTWEPILREVELFLDSNPKHSISSACKIVAKRTGKNKGTLKNRYHKFKKNK